MTSNNVIVFPRENKNIRKAVSIEEINESVEQISLYHIQETIANIMPIIFAQLEVAGFFAEDLDEEETIKYAAFVVESMRSFLCAQYGIYHPFQTITENIFEPDLTEEGALKIVDEINVKFDKKEKDEE